MREFYYGYSRPNKLTNFLDVLAKLFVGAIVVVGLICLELAFLFLLCNLIPLLMGAVLGIAIFTGGGAVVTKSAFTVAGASTSVVASSALIYGAIALAAVVGVGVGIKLISRYAKNLAEQEATADNKQVSHSTTSSLSSTQSSRAHQGSNIYQQAWCQHDQQGYQQPRNSQQDQQRQWSFGQPYRASQSQEESVPPVNVSQSAFSL